MDTWSEAGDDDNNENIVTQIVPKKSTANRTLIQKLEAILSSYELQEKYSTKLTSHSLEVIEHLIKHKPEFFRMVESTLVRNVHGNKIKSNDIPYIISMISQLYNLLLVENIDNANNELPADTCTYILKFVFSVVIRENLVHVDDETGATLLLLCCDNIIDACTKLLKLKVPKPTPIYISPTPTPIMQDQKGGCCY